MNALKKAFAGLAVVAATFGGKEALAQSASTKATPTTDFNKAKTEIVTPKTDPGVRTPNPNAKVGVVSLIEECKEHGDNFADLAAKLKSTEVSGLIVVYHGSNGTLAKQVHEGLTRAKREGFSDPGVSGMIIGTGKETISFFAKGETLGTLKVSDIIDDSPNSLAEAVYYVVAGANGVKVPLSAVTKENNGPALAAN